MFSVLTFWIALANHSTNLPRSKDAATDIKLELLMEIKNKCHLFIKVKK